MPQFIPFIQIDSYTVWPHAAAKCSYDRQTHKQEAHLCSSPGRAELALWICEYSEGRGHSLAVFGEDGPDHRPVYFLENIR